MDVKRYVSDMAKAAKIAAQKLSCVPMKVKDNALETMASGLIENAERIKQENNKDLEEARKSGLPGAIVDRLKLDDKRIGDMATGLREIAIQPDPIGAVEELRRRPNGMEVGKMRVPIGVIGIVYESRPNVTADAAGLCVKSGNAVILRGGSEALFSNVCIANILSDAAESAGLPERAINLIETTERKAVIEMLKAEGLIDLVVPRGGKGLIKTVMDNSLIPVIKHYDGVCHVYVDDEADLDMALRIAYNAKAQRPGVCNAMETLLVNSKVADSFLPKIAQKLEEAGVEIRGCERTRNILSPIESIGDRTQAATQEDWYAEYLDLILAVAVVDSIDEAMDHIDVYGSHHTDAIVTDNYFKARKFVMSVDSSSVMVNASTRLSDGAIYGLGAEVGISTDKLHARGPMGAESLTTYKWVVYGDGQLRE